MEINLEEKNRVLRLARNTIAIVKAIEEGMTPNEIVQKVGCNQSVARYYLRLLVK